MSFAAEPRHLQRSWYRETVITPFPASDSLYYVFSTNVFVLAI
jgi:hypothetical protein